MSNLAGLHDIEGASIAPPDTWILDTIALSENPPGRHYPVAFNHIARLNFGYGSQGTLPTPDGYNDFAARVGRYVSASSGCHRWVIGNEPSLPREWPNGEPIYPWHYAACYKLCRDTIHALAGHQRDEVLIAASGPWNNELSYSTNASGDWINYFADQVALCAPDMDGFAIHAYTHSYDPALVTSEARMDYPFQNRHYEFRTYQDYCDAIPPAFAYLPCYLTEANGDGPWQAVGLMPAMLGEIDLWNRSNNAPLIHAVIFYRYPRYDHFFIEGKGDVIAEYYAAVNLGYDAALPSGPPKPEPPPEPTPQPPTPAPEPTPDREIDPVLAARGVEFDFVSPSKGTGYWRIVKAEWLDEQEADAVGPDHHILGTVKRDRQEVADIPLRVSWPSGSTIIRTKRPQIMILYNYDFPMSSSLNEFSIWVDDGNPSDKVSGIGMGAHGNPSIHTSTWLDFEWAIAEGIKPPIPPEPGPQPPAKTELVHPLPGAVITQNFYEESDAYEQYGFRAHNGTDMGGRPLRTPVRSIADGIVAYSDFDAGYGFYCRLDYRDLDCYVMYCHLDEAGAAAGTRLEAGDTVGLLGSSGNSSGAHLHVEVRLQNKDGTYREDTPMIKGRVDPRTWAAMHGLKL